LAASTDTVARRSRAISEEGATVIDRSKNAEMKAT
jgi:hypothetical protein